MLYEDPGLPHCSGPAMAVTITLKTLQQQTFKIRMEPEETVRAGAQGREQPGARVGGGREARIQREGRGGRAAGPCSPSPAARPPRIPPPTLPCPGDSGAIPGLVPGRVPRPALVSAAGSVSPACKLLGWPRVASVAKRCQPVTTMLMTINGLGLNSFGRPCLLAGYSLPVSSC